MCKPLPAGRCSSHVKKELDNVEARSKALLTKRAKAIAEHASHQTIASIDAKLNEAANRRHVLMEEYLETPAGQKMLEARIKELDNQPRDRNGQNKRVMATLQAKKDAAAQRRAHKDALYKQAQEEKKNATFYREEAAKHAAEAQESFERSDTDGALSQWGSAINAALYGRKAEIAENGGKAEFPALFDLNGNLVPAKRVMTRYGLAWGLLSDPEDSSSSFEGWVNESQAKDPAKRVKALEDKGYRMGTVLAPAGAKLDAPDGARGLSGVNAVFVNTYRRDGGFSRDVEIVSDGTSNS